MSADIDKAEQALAKSLRLRGPPAPVARLSRPALIVAGAALAAGVAAALGWSLIARRAPAAVETSVVPPSPPQELSALPRGYLAAAKPPSLGPPLPGDLGRPILSAARAGRPVDWPKTDPAGEPMDRSSTRPAPSQARFDPLAQAHADARSAASASPLFAALAPTAQGPAHGEQTAASGEPVQDPRATSGERLQAPASPYILQAGSMIPAALVTGLRSDAPGLAVAQVTQDVFDSLGGGVLLIPAGARLVGDYDAQVQAGQSRLRVVWTRLILPTGRSILLDKLPGADAQGMAGLQDGVDRHGRQVLAAAGLATLLAIGAEAGGGSEDSDLARALRRAGGETASGAGQQMVGKTLDLAPTLTIRPGASLRVLLTRDLVLEPYAARAADAPIPERRD